MQGHVIQFSYTETSGSIHPDDDSGDVPFQASSVEGNRSLHASERVEFDVIYGPTGPEAVDVRLVSQNDRREPAEGAGSGS